MIAQSTKRWSMRRFLTERHPTASVSAAGLLTTSFNNHQYPTTTTQLVQQQQQLLLLRSSSNQSSSNNSNNKNDNNLTRRLFHSTSQRDILPLVAVGAVALVGRYSLKAFNRMDTEWDEYLWELKKYERDRLKGSNGSSTVQQPTTTIGVDLGTIYLKLSRMNKNKPELIETPQGDRYRFNGIILQDDGDSNNKNDDDQQQIVVSGKAALDKFYYPPQESTSSDDRVATSTTITTSTTGNVTLPYMQLRQEIQSDVTKLVQRVFLPAVQEAMDRVTSGTNYSSTNENDATNNKRSPLRAVLTLPPSFYKQHGKTLFRDNSNFHDKGHHTITVPDPVAAIWGAQVLDLIPTPQSMEENESFKTLVIDVGGLASTISIVQDDRVVSFVTLDNVGGESYVRRLVDRILKEAGDDDGTDSSNLATDPMALTLIQSSARSSVLELVNKTQTKVHIPFLFMGRKKDSPHLDTTISRIALDQAVQDHWNTVVIPTLVQQNRSLSSSFPPPVGAASLFMSAITRVLEDANEIPTNMKYILLVGGGSRLKLFEDACRDSLLALMGPSDNRKLIIAEQSVRPELTALGAASLLPNFDYDYDKGLESTSQ